MKGLKERLSAACSRQSLVFFAEAPQVGSLERDRIEGFPVNQVTGQLTTQRIADDRAAGGGEEQGAGLRRHARRWAGLRRRTSRSSP